MLIDVVHVLVNKNLKFVALMEKLTGFSNFLLATLQQLFVIVFSSIIFMWPIVKLPLLLIDYTFYEDFLSLSEIAVN